MGQKENKEKEKTARETLGKYFYDMSKLIFTAVVLTNITALNNMDTMLFTMTCIVIVSVGILLWTNTKAGKKWLENL